MPWQKTGHLRPYVGKIHFRRHYWLIPSGNTTLMFFGDLQKLILQKSLFIKKNVTKFFRVPRVIIVRSGQAVNHEGETMQVLKCQRIVKRRFFLKQFTRIFVYIYVGKMTHNGPLL